MVLGITDNKYILLLIMNVFLLVVGTFMDMAPALLIFTPTFLPIVRSFGMTPVQFRVMIVFNLAVGTVTPPVGNVLFVGCSLVKLNLVIDKLMHLDTHENEESLESGGEAKGFFRRDFGINEWDWPQGVGLYGLLKMMQYNGTDEYREFLINNKMWIDTLFMTGLFFHGWSFNRMDNFGGVFWCRGNSWFTLGILDWLEMFRGTLNRGVRMLVLDTYLAQAKALKGLQDESGLWHTVLDDATSYLEVSGSAAITAGILKGVRSGILDDSYIACTEKAVRVIMSNIASDGTVQNVSGGTGMGMNAEHYKNILIAPMAYGQSLVILALAEALKGGIYSDD